MAQTPNTCLISAPGYITTHQAPTNNSCGCNKKPILDPCDVFKPPCSLKCLWLVCFDNVWLQCDNAKANVMVVLGTALKLWNIGCKKRCLPFLTLKWSQNVPETVVADYVIWSLILCSSNPEVKPRTRSCFRRLNRKRSYESCRYITFL